MSGENTQQFPLKISPTLLLEIAIPVLSLGGAVIALLLAQAGSPVDVRYFGIGCVAGSFILAYLAWIRPHKDIVALSTPIYSFLFFVIPSDTAVTIFLEFLYAASLTILLIRLKLRFGPAPESGRSALIVLNDPLKSYCESLRESSAGISPQIAHYAAVAFARFSQGEYQDAADIAETANADPALNSSFPVLRTAFDILQEHALLLEESKDRPDVFIEFAIQDAGLLAKPLPPEKKINDRFEGSLDNALLLLFAAAWNGSVKDQPLLLNGQNLAQKLMTS